MLNNTTNTLQQYEPKKVTRLNGKPTIQLQLKTS